MAFSSDARAEAADDKPVRPPPAEVAAKLGKREYNACLANAAATLNLANGYSPDAAPLLEAVEEIFRTLASERPSLPPYDNEEI